MREEIGIGSVTRINCIREFDWRREDSRETGRLYLGLNSNRLKGKMDFRVISKRGREVDLNSGKGMLHDFGREDDDDSEFSGMLSNTEDKKVRGERFERLCPDKANRLNFLVPTPSKYSAPIPWPRSRDEVCCNLSPLFF